MSFTSVGLRIRWFQWHRVESVVVQCPLPCEVSTELSFKFPASLLYNETARIRMSTNVTTILIDSSELLPLDYIPAIWLRKHDNYPLLQEHAMSIDSTKRETFQYGPTGVHQVWHVGTFFFRSS